MPHGAEFQSRLGMATNTPSSVYKPLHEYRILRVSNSPHLCELCTTLSVVAQHLPLCTVSSFTKRPACLKHLKFGCQRRAIARTQSSQSLCATHSSSLACPRGASRANTRKWVAGHGQAPCKGGRPRPNPLVGAASPQGAAASRRGRLRAWLVLAGVGNAHVQAVRGSRPRPGRRGWLPAVRLQGAAPQPGLSPTRAAAGRSVHQQGQCLRKATPPEGCNAYAGQRR
ncbi:hypothetical protein BHM03_00020614 [Ensete ventricosum]|nr:hypothetical protein BHM03_00020614 [Ensete ventricosum]